MQVRCSGNSGNESQLSGQARLVFVRNDVLQSGFRVTSIRNL